MDLVAHPLTVPHVLPVSPVVLAASVAVLVAGTALWWPSRRAVAPGGEVFASWEGGLDRARVAGRVVAVALLLLAVAAGRAGSERELANLAPALVVGAAWPGLLALSATLGPVWRWLDPWDGAARLLAPSGAGEGAAAADVRWALVPSMAWAAYLTVYRTPLSPRSVGLALGVYTIVTIAGCLAAGRVSWLSRVEVFGLLFSWTARLPRGQLRAWQPPRGASAVVGALTGGLLFGAIRRSELWGGLNVGPRATVVTAVGFVAVAAVAGTAAATAEWWAGRRGARGAVASALVPVSAATAIVVGLVSERLITSILLLPSLASDPFGRGWDLFGTAGRGLPAGIGPTRVAALQAAVLLAGYLAGAAVAAGRGRPARVPAALLLSAGAGGSMLVIASV
jgi:hypothetical protein